MRTQFFENWNGSVTAHEPRAHHNETAAHAYAAELSSRRGGREVHLLNAHGTPTGVYIDGVKK